MAEAGREGGCAQPALQPQIQVENNAEKGEEQPLRSTPHAQHHPFAIGSSTRRAGHPHALSIPTEKPNS